ncbi:MAG: hypothetical protein V3R94_07930 [Acidobacteriota bacterium]
MRRLCIGFMMVLLASPLAVAQTTSDSPAPRAPRRVRITRADQLLPNARIVVRRPYHWSVTAHYGLGLKEGEKLLIVGSAIDPLVVQAIAMAAEEIGVSTDVVTRNIAPLARRMGREELDYERFNPGTYLGSRGITSRAGPDWLMDMADDYDVILGLSSRGSRFGRIGNKTARVAGLDWSTAQQLASPAVSYPDEVLDIIAKRTWRTLVNGKSFHITDPLGTDLTFSIDETNIERLKDTRGMATFGSRTLERPIAHEGSQQLEPQLNVTPDARGVMITRQAGYIPEIIKIYFEGGRVIRVEGGGQVGETIRAELKRFEDVQFPGFYPGPGVGWLEELAMGIHPKVGPAGPIRRRSGMLQLAFGTDRHNAVRDERPTLTVNHRDINFFDRVTIEVDDQKLVDRGRLTVLDDPEVRRVAAQHGDPDELLSEDWIPEFDQQSGRIIYPPFEKALE